MPAMESPEQSGEEREVPEVTEGDRQNEKVRRAIADAQLAAYTEVLKWAMGAFGVGWRPSHRHFLLEKEEEEKARRTGERPIAAATVYTVKSEEGGRRHFTVSKDGVVTECESMEAGFGEKLLEPHPTRTIEVRGQMVHPHRYSLCFAPFELYEPKSAADLAKLRQTRERLKKERDDAKWAREHPLLAQAGFRGKEGDPGWEEGESVADPPA